MRLGPTKTRTKTYHVASPMDTPVKGRTGKITAHCSACGERITYIPDSQPHRWTHAR